VVGGRETVPVVAARGGDTIIINNNSSASVEHKTSERPDGSKVREFIINETKKGMEQGRVRPHHGHLGAEAPADGPLMVSPEPVHYDLGTYDLPSGARVAVFADVVILLRCSAVPPEERGAFIDDALPQAVASLRRQLSGLVWNVGGWQVEDAEP
jgi:hypothetical protein